MNSTLGSTNHVRVLRRRPFALAVAITMPFSLAALWLGSVGRPVVSSGDIAALVVIAALAAVPLMVSAAWVSWFDRPTPAVSPSDARYTAWLSSLPDAVAALDAMGTIVAVNWRFEHLVGYSRAELIGRPFDAFIASTNAGDETSAVAPRERTTHTSATARRKDGSEFTAEIASGAVWFDRGPAVVAIVRDVSPRLAAGDLREEYLSLIAHDLRAPLATVLIHAETLRSASALISPADRLRASSAITRSAQMMNRLIQDLLDSARIDSGVLALSRSEIDVGALVVHATEASFGPWDQRRLTFELPSQPAVVAGDRARLERVVVNLVSNALKYSPAEEPVTVRVESLPSGVQLSVVDRGAGIARDQQSRLFQKFYRVHRGSVAGVGLGLYITRRLVEAHGGRLSLTSAQGRGSTFTVALPRPERPATVAVPVRSERARQPEPLDVARAAS